MKMNLEDDPFLSLLCYDKNDENEDDVITIEDWSASEQDNESNSDENHEHDVVYPFYGPNLVIKPIVGMKFESPSQLKESLIDYGVSNGYPLVFLVNDHNRLLVRCGKEETEDDGDGNKKKYNFYNGLARGGPKN
ncbi:hypothetical protein R6Q57_027898 [Mikania cordata]